MFTPDLSELCTVEKPKYAINYKGAKCSTLSGGLIFILVFCSTSLFFLMIMTVVCCGEFKEYRNRGPRKPPVRQRENEPLNKEKVETVANSNMMSEEQEIKEQNKDEMCLQESHQRICTVDATVKESKHQDRMSLISEDTVEENNSQDFSNSSGLPSPVKKRTELDPLYVSKNSTVIVADTDQSYPFSPPPKNISQKVGFIDQPLPAIQEKKSGLPQVN